MPIYTYRCDAGHQWEEVRPIEGSETSSEPCATCLEVIDCAGVDVGENLSDFAGRRVPSTGVSAHFKGSGWTPKFYPNRRGK